MLIIRFCFRSRLSIFKPRNTRENAVIKRLFQIMVVVAILVTSFASSGGALAWSGCASYITVQWGDTLSGIAATCGTTVEAIQAANSGLGWWVYAGQVLCIPTGYTSAPVSYPTYGGTYVVQRGDTLGKIAASIGVSWRDILAVNPQIWNPSLIYAGQVINLPAGAGVPPPVYDHPPKHPTYPPPVVDSYSTLKIDYKHGLYVRSNPGGTIIASALDKTTWYYRQNSIFIDKHWKVWAEVKLYPPVKGYSTGWILVKDQLGKYFTDPQIDK
jgi:LysM repeat protein